MDKRNFETIDKILSANKDHFFDLLYNQLNKSFNLIETITLTEQQCLKLLEASNIDKDFIQKELYIERYDKTLPITIVIENLSQFRIWIKNSDKLYGQIDFYKDSTLGNLLTIIDRTKVNTITYQTITQKNREIKFVRPDYESYLKEILEHYNSVMKDLQLCYEIIKRLNEQLGKYTLEQIKQMNDDKKTEIFENQIGIKYEL